MAYRVLPARSGFIRVYKPCGPVSSADRFMSEFMVVIKPVNSLHMTASARKWNPTRAGVAGPQSTRVCRIR